jgi:uncharacterized Tic20 family protein
MSDPSPDSAANIPPKPETPPADSQAPPPAGESGALPVAQNQDDKTMGLLCHLLGPFTHFLGPLVIWLIKKDQSKFVDDQGKEALNFQILILLLHLAAGVTCLLIPGALNGIVGILSLVFSIIAAMEANKGVAYRYPFNIRLIK